MGRYDSLKHPFHARMSDWVAKKSQDIVEQQPKSIPCHVVKVDKDFIYVAFETQNGIFTPPTVKIPQSWSQYSREPTQVGDKGYAVPGHYYLGGVTGDSGGNTDFYPRGNLTTLSFNGTSHTQSPQRDYDQLTHMGGPTGWIVRAFQKQQQDQQQNQQNQSPQVASLFRLQSTNFRREQQRLSISPLIATTSGTSSTDQQQSQQDQQNQDQTQFSFDKNGKAVVQSKDTDHVITVDQQNQKITVKVPTDHTVYLGGDGKEGTYCKVQTVCGTSINVKARVG